EWPIEQDALGIGGRADAVVAREARVEPHVFARHVASDAGRAGSAWVVVGVRAKRLGFGEGRVTARARAVAAGRLDRLGLRASLARVVRVVARRARERAGAAAQEEVTRLARVDRAAAGRGALSPSPFPRPGIAREEHLMTARAHAIDRLRARGRGIARG